MAGDVRDTDRYRRVEALVRSVFEPGFGRPHAFDAAEASPDGRFVAVAGLVFERLEGHPASLLWIATADGQRTWTVTTAAGDAVDPRWSPDGRSLSFLADHHDRHRHAPWIVDVGEDGPVGEPRRLACPPGIAEHHRWSPDGRRILLVVAGEHAEQADGLGSGTVGQGAAAADRPAWVPDVETSGGEDEWRSAWTLDPASGEVRRISSEGLNVWEAAWLGDDRVVAIVSDGPAEDAWYGARVVALDAATGVVTELWTPEWQLGFVEGAPDGRRAAVIEAVGSDRYFVAGALAILDAAGGAVIIDTPGVDVASARWLDGERLLALGVSGMETVALAIDLRTGEARETFRTRSTSTSLFPMVSPLGTGGEFVTILDGPEAPGRVVAIRGRDETTVLGSEHAGRDRVRACIAERHVETWASRDGTRIEGLLTVPHGEPPFATVLWVHGGPVDAVGWGFPSADLAVLVEAGYAVLMPNPRGSIGRGRDFAAFVVGDMGGEESHDLLSGLDHLVSLGIADPARLAVGGVSYGGYMAALLPAVDDRFAAAVVGSPLTDLISSHYGSSLSVFVRDYVGGRPTDQVQRYLDRSPVFAGSRLRTPTLLVTGLRDRATPVGQAVEMFRALREQGVPTELVVYPEEGHGVRAYPARIDWIARAVMWLERYAPARRA
jgi:dipeptidyl aminopeptidase/acylaminoacyl peptidase